MRIPHAPAVRRIARWAAAFPLATLTIVQTSHHAAAQTAPAAAQEAPVDEPVRLNREAVAKYQQGQIDEAIAIEKRAIALWEKKLGRDHLDLVKGLSNLGAFFLAKNDFDKAEAAFKRALAIREKRLGAGHSDVAESLHNLGVLYAQKGDAKRAEELYRRAIALREKLGGPDGVGVAAELLELGALYKEKNDYPQAQAILERALRIFDAAGDARTSQVLNHLAPVLFFRQSYAAAEKAFRRLADLWEKEKGPEHSDVITLIDNIAASREALSDDAGAEPFRRKVLALREKTLGPDHIAVASSLRAIAKIEERRSKFDRSEALLRRALAITEKQLGPKHVTTGEVALELAAHVGAQGKVAEARQIYMRAIAVLEKALGPEHTKIAEALVQLAHVCKVGGEYGLSRSLLDRALAIREKALGPNHPVVARTLVEIDFLPDGSTDPQAEARIERAKAIMEKAHGKDSAQVAEIAGTLGRVLARRGDYDRAEQLLKATLATHEKASGPESLAVAGAASSLGKLYQERGRYTLAEPLLLRAKGIWERKVGPDNPLIAARIGELGRLRARMGDYDRAEALLRQTLALYRKAHGPDHPEAALTLLNLGSVYADRGDIVRAEEHQRQALGAWEKSMGPEDETVAIALSNLAALYLDGANPDRAEPLLMRGRAIYDKLGKTDTPAACSLLVNIGKLYEERGEFERAEPFLQRALATWERAYGPGDPHVADGLNALAVNHLQRGEFDRAEPLLRRSLSIKEATLGPEHPDVAGTLTNLGTLLDGKQDHAQAEALHERAIRILEKAFGQDHPDVMIAVSNLGMHYWKRGDIAKAQQMLQKSSDATERYIPRVLVAGNDRDRRALAEPLQNHVHAFVSLHLQAAQKSDTATRQALQATLRAKGRALDAVAQGLGSLRKTLGSEDQALLDELASARAEASQAALSGKGAKTPEEHESRVAALRARSEELETKLVARALSRRVDTEPVTLGRVQAAVPDNAVLVEIVLYRSFDIKAKRSKRGLPPHYRYAAYTLRHTGAPGSVDLGEAEPIDSAVQHLREALADPSRDAETPSRDVHRRVLGPIERLIGESGHILLVPDGPLNLVPFGALIDEGGTYAAARHAFTYLTSGRDLLRMQGAVKPRGGAIFIANPDFGPMSLGNASRGTGMSRVVFPPLPGTADEVKALSGILRNASVFDGPRATKAAMTAAHGPSILHVATHGFFLPDRGQPGSRALVLTDPVEDHKAAASENPLLRSGLAFAGANLHRPDNDGLLTAMEAASLDLSGTQLVVLSACETGVGQVQGGDGVYGLRRAFVVAGAQSVVMSLWKVDDEATRDLMIAYYRAIQSGAGRTEALRRAQLGLLQNEKTRHPYYWAAFIASGDYRPLNGNAAPTGLAADGQFARVHGGACGCSIPGGDPSANGIAGALLALGMALACRRLARRRERHAHPLLHHAHTPGSHVPASP
jgi:CHAT domain-containing protein/Tfp pilus assembly protein PilF